MDTNVSSLVDIAELLLEKLKDLNYDLVGKYLTSDMTIKKFPYLELFALNPNLEPLTKRVAISLILMHYEQACKSLKLKQYLKDSDLKTCFLKFYQNDDFRSNSIATYYTCFKNFNIEEVSNKYQVLVRFKKINKPQN